MIQPCWSRASVRVLVISSATSAVIAGAGLLFAAAMWLSLAITAIGTTWMPWRTDPLAVSDSSDAFLPLLAAALVVALLWVAPVLRRPIQHAGPRRSLRPGLGEAHPQAHRGDQRPLISRQLGAVQDLGPGDLGRIFFFSEFAPAVAGCCREGAGGAVTSWSRLGSS